MGRGRNGDIEKCLATEKGLPKAVLCKAGKPEQTGFRLDRFSSSMSLAFCLFRVKRAVWLPPGARNRYFFVLIFFLTLYIISIISWEDDAYIQGSDAEMDMYIDENMERSWT